MIEVKNLSKKYGDTTALNGVSFAVSQGNVVGFLGPNGAGKSTTMRILCGCIGATSGEALIAGKDVLRYPKAVKRSIGYLPELPPLYPNMVVKDYLRFAAGIKGANLTDKELRKIIDMVGLQQHHERIIANLSKGYRQRVGLAQALVHSPEVLVLDEPTSGLDPAQRKEIRQLLQELAAGKRTVILSTHILGEVEAVCQRAIIISNGEIITEDSIENLRSLAKRISLTIANPSPDFADKLAAVPGVLQVLPISENNFELDTEGDIRPEIAQFAVTYGLLELRLSTQFEDIYLRLTQGEEA